jgi:sulfite reductase (NADPH) hemoprotein beta-component
VHETGAENFTRMVEEEWQALKDSPLDLPEAEIDRIKSYFAPPVYENLSDATAELDLWRAGDRAFDMWVDANVAQHRVPGYAIANISLKPIGGVPGDATADQMEAIADLAERYGSGEIRVSHEQNLVLGDVKQHDLYRLWRELKRLDLATPNLGLISDMIACPGLDYCSLANARSIPIAQEISERFADLERQHDIGELKVKISGCINACGHHHVGHIGILGVDKKGVEHYQITLGGSADQHAALGKIVGPAFSGEQVTDAVETIVETYLDIRETGESFLEAFQRAGLEPFKERLYGAH